MDDHDSRSTISGQGHWTNKGDVRLFLFEKSADRPDPNGTVLFVHGSSMASQPTFDLPVPGGRPHSSSTNSCGSVVRR